MPSCAELSQRPGPAGSKSRDAVCARVELRALAEAIGISLDTYFVTSFSGPRLARTGHTIAHPRGKNHVTVFEKKHAYTDKPTNRHPCMHVIHILYCNGLAHDRVESRVDPVDAEQRADTASSRDQVS